MQICQHISVTATTSRSSTKEVAQRRSTTRGRMDLSRGPILHPGIKHINLYPYFLVSTYAKLFTYLQLSYIRKNNSTVTLVIFNYLLHKPQTLNTFSQLHNVPKKLEINCNQIYFCKTDVHNIMFSTSKKKTSS